MNNIPSTSASQPSFDQAPLLPNGTLSALKAQILELGYYYRDLKNRRDPNSISQQRAICRELMQAHHLMALNLKSLTAHDNWHDIRKQYGAPETHHAFALLQALRLSWNVAVYCGHSLASANPSDRYIAVGLDAWAEREEISQLQAKGEAADRELSDNYRQSSLKRTIELEMRSLHANPDNQVLHAAGFLQGSARLLARIQQSIEGTVLSDADAFKGICQAMQAASTINVDKKRVIIAGLDWAARRNGLFSEGGLQTSVPTTLATAWTYIVQRPDPILRANLIEVLLERLAEIGTEMPCDTGCVQRILQFADGVDPALMMDGVPAPMIEHDVTTRVARLCEWLENIMEDADRKPAFLRVASQGDQGDVTGRIINWMQTTIRESVRTAYERLGHQPSVYKDYLLRQLDGIEANTLMMNDLTLETVGLTYRNHQGKSALIRLIETDDHTGMQALLASLSRQSEPLQEGFLNATCNYDRTAIIYAMLRADLRAFKLLLDTPLINLNRVAPSIENHPVFFACHHNRLDILNAVLSSVVMDRNSQRWNVNAHDFYGNTALHLAIKRGNNECVDLLLDHESCDVNLPDLQGTTPLHSATRQLNVTALEYLLYHPRTKSSIEPNRVDSRGASALVLLLNHPVWMLRNATEEQLGTLNTVRDCVTLLLTHPKIELREQTLHGGDICQLLINTRDRELLQLYAEQLNRSEGGYPDTPSSSLHSGSDSDDSWIGSETESDSAISNESDKSGESARHRARGQRIE